MSRFSNLFQNKLEQISESESDKQLIDSESEQTQAEKPKGESKSTKRKGKRGNPKYSQAMFYLTKATHKKFKQYALKQGRDMSDMAEEAILEYLSKD